MLDLEKNYLMPSHKDNSSYLLKLTKKDLPLGEHLRYLYNSESDNSFLLEKELSMDETVRNSIVKFVFRVDGYRTNVFSRHIKPNSDRLSRIFKEILPKVKKSTFKRDFLLGCVLKQVKGGFTVDLNGLVCFMPYSLSEGTRFRPYKPKPNAIQLFQSGGLSLAVTSEKMVFLNLIVSRKNNEKLFKGLLRKSLEKKVFNLRYSMSSEQNRVKATFLKRDFKILSIVSKTNKVNTIRLVKSVRLPFHQLSKALCNVK